MLIMRWKIYINRSRDLDELKENTLHEIVNLKVMETVIQRMRLYLNNNSGHLWYTRLTRDPLGQFELKCFQYFVRPFSVIIPS